MRPGLWYVAVLATLWATGCADAAPPARQPELPGTRWELTVLRGAAPVAGTSVTAEFTEDRIAGSAGCNRYFGPVTLGAGTITVPGPLGTTMMACDPAVMAQETAYLTAVQGARAYSLEADRLTLLDEAGNKLAGFVATSQDLAGTTWTVTAVNTGSGAVTSLLPGTTATLTFGADGKLTGHTGCNTVSGRYSVAEGTLTITDLAGTEIACPEPDGVMQQEGQLLTALRTATGYVREGTGLTLRSGTELAVQLARA